MPVGHSVACLADGLHRSVARMLVWERREHGTGMLPPWCELDLSKLRPLNGFVTRVLSPALGGAWDLRDTGQAAGAWRTYVKDLRDRVIHAGYRPTDHEVDDAIAAANGLVAHVNDRLAARAQRFPRTAAIVVVRPGLERRGAWDKVRATVESPVDWRAEYRAWVASGSGSGSGSGSAEDS